MTADRERCTKQHAQTARKNAKCRSNRAAIGLFIVESAIRSIDPQDIKGQIRFSDMNELGDMPYGIGEENYV